MYLKSYLHTSTYPQVPDEKFLVLINDLLASGEIPDLFQDDELETVINGVRNEVKGAGLQDTKENCWSFFIDRVRRQLKVSVSVCIYIYMCVYVERKQMCMCVDLLQRKKQKVYSH